MQFSIVIYFLSFLVSSKISSLHCQITVSRFYGMNKRFLNKHQNFPESTKELVVDEQRKFCQTIVSTNQFFAMALEEYVDITNTEVFHELVKFSKNKLLKYHYNKESHKMKFERDISSSSKSEEVFQKCISDICSKFLASLFHSSRKNDVKIWGNFRTIISYHISSNISFRKKVSLDNKLLDTFLIPCVVRNSRTGELKQYFISNTYQDQLNPRFLFTVNEKQELIVLAVISQWTLTRVNRNGKRRLERKPEILANPTLNWNCRMKTITHLILCEALTSKKFVKWHEPKFWPTRFNVEGCIERTVQHEYNPIKPYTQKYKELLVRCRTGRKDGKSQNYYVSWMYNYLNIYSIYTYESPLKSQVTNEKVFKNKIDK